ncbi:7-cyano-7-deazaguanine synthase QueC [Sulfurospirillum deleyianum]|uniref:7-cyano-7-deazaguanine synthase n=1 Tax=Sulfurospirillum deleyianum (strain ATCC 51133 / DSM 6946 / 5175) TaxID=525898 RepID=D1B472_SULD5|nr:7-cyano-7-deazaguanine synthase QueC [Sulfurospirillum deleyianum]ACZ12892.1 exsB protein [Sulfurospirillum deleyianum DSM 6946]
MSKALVVFSGGQDSTTCLGWAKNRFEYVESITFDYGQKHKVEIAQAQKIASLLHVKNTLLSLDAFSQLNDSALIDSTQDIGAHHRVHTNLPASFVPNRNAIFFTLAHAFAQKQGIEHIIIGVNQTDYSGYPDCREPFVKALELALNLGSEANITFHYPLMHLTKAETFLLSKEEGVLDLVLNESHTCYNGEHSEKHTWGYGCGECPACVLRKQGWEAYEKGI